MATAPDLDSLKDWLDLEADDTSDDVVLQISLDAALAAQAQVVTYPTDPDDPTDPPPPVWTDDLVDAVYIRAQRLAARRNSPEGVVGLSGIGGDFVSARIPGYDADVAALEGPYRKIPVA